MATVLSPRVSEDDVARAVERFTAELGADQVLTGEEALLEFQDPMQPPSWKQYTGSCVVFPESVEDVQAIVRIANECRMPLWPIGQGRNNAYGGPAPRVRGCAIICFRRMDRVLEINEELAYAVVEPGVRWFDLYDAIKAGGHRLMLSVPDLGWGSIVGNSLENGVTYLPYGQDQAALCSLEVVLANGDVMRTGMGAMPGNRAWHIYKRSLGPTPTQLFTQSNYGIATKMGIWLMPAPECVMPVWLRAWKHEDIAPIADTLRRLMLDRVLEGVPSVYGTLGVAASMDKRERWWTSEEPIPDAKIDEIAKELEVGRWLMRASLYGSERMVDLQFATVKEAFGRIPGVEVWGTKRGFDDLEHAEHFHELVVSGVPNLEMNQMTAWYGGEEGGHVDFSPVVPLTGQDVLRVNHVLRNLVEEKARLDYMVGLLAINPRSAINIALIAFDTKDEAQARRAYDTAQLLVREAAKEGYGEYRAHLDFMDLAAEQYSFNDHAYRRFCERLKDALDPNGILAPGKQGIWPARLRGGNGKP
jgi:4-cresol dehydrogenase (hydroxylating)